MYVPLRSKSSCGAERRSSSDSRISRDTRGMVHEIHWFGDPAACVGFSVHFRKGWGPIAVSQH